MQKRRNTAAAPAGEHKSAGQKAVDKFTEMMIARMEEMKAGEWKKGWIDGKSVFGMPQNITGRTYSGSNSFFLQMDAAMNGYRTPVYLTFLQIQKEGAHVNKGATAMPVIYWDFSIQDKDGRRVSSSDYRNMSKEEQEKHTVVPFLKAYSVFNIDQTNLQEANKEKYDKLVEKFLPPEIKDAKGMYVNAALDRLFEKQEWVCPIQVDQIADGAFYSPSRDKIVVPKKEQFHIGETPEETYKDGMEYYSSALHEMAHSTGSPGRLNRVKGDKFGAPKYAKEELVAELTAANVGYAMGFDRRILDNNAAYLDGWISVLKENPKFIVSVMADVNKASAMVLEAVDKQRLALGQDPILDRNREESAGKEQSTKQTPTVKVDTADAPRPTTKEKPSTEEGTRQEAAGPKFDNAAIIKKKNGEYAIRASYQGTQLGMKPVDRETGARYFLLPEGGEKQALLAAELRSKYGKEPSSPVRQESRGVKR